MQRIEYHQLRTMPIASLTSTFILRWCPPLAFPLLHTFTCSCCSLPVSVCRTCGLHRESVPRNAARVLCGNCETPFVFKEYEETCEARSAWEAIAANLEAAVINAKKAEDEATSNRDRAKLEVSMNSCITPGILSGV